jgi:hypothetical protein
VSRDDDHAGSVATPSVAGPDVEGDIDHSASESRYRVGGELGRGAMGVVNAGYDPLLARDVALKRPRHEGGAAQLLRESRVAARLDHPAIPAVLDFVEDDGVPVAVLQVRRGVDWRAAVARRGPPPDRPVLRALLEAALAIAHAHERGVLHRDLGPQNVRVDDDGAVSVIDWGLAVAVADAERFAGRVGTPGFTAPEVERGEAASARSDVWSLGTLLRIAVGSTSPARPSSCPLPLWAIVARATAANPDHRYADAGAFARDLAAFLDDEPVTAHVDGPVERLARAVRRAPRAAAVVVFAAVLVAVAAGVAAVAARRGAEVSGARLLDAAERAIAADELTAAAALLEGIAAVDANDRARLRGVQAATARATRTTLQSSRALCSEGNVVDVIDERVLCVHGDRATLTTSDAIAARAAGIDHVVGGCLLADGRVVLATAAPGQLATAVTIDTDTVTTSALAGGDARVFCDRHHKHAVVQSFDIAAVVRAQESVVVSTPCPPAVGLVRLAPRHRGDDVAVCSDGSIARLAGGARWAIAVEHTALAGQSTAALLDDTTLLVATTHGQVSTFVLDDDHATRVGRRQLAVGAVRQIDVVSDDMAIVAGAAGTAWWRPGIGTAGTLVNDRITRFLSATDDDVTTTIGALRGACRVQWSVHTPVADVVGPDGRSMLLAHDDRLLVGDGAARVVDVDLHTGNGQVLSTGPRRVIKAAALGPRGTLVVGAAGDDGVMFFERDTNGFARVAGPFDDVPERRARHVFFVDDDTLAFLTWSELRVVHRDGRRFVGDNVVALDPADMPAGVVDVVAVAPIVGGAVGVDVDGRVLRFGRTASGAVGAVRLGHIPGATAIAATVDGARVVLGRNDEIVAVDGSLVQRVRGVVSDLAIAADGRVAWCTRDGAVGFDDATIAAHDDRCAAVTFCDNDHAVCSAGWDGRVRVLQRR